MKIKIAANGIIVKNKKILLIKRSAKANYFPNYWLIPGGKIKSKEKIENGLKRELKEETGFSVKIKEMIKVSDVFHRNHRDIIFDYLVTPIKGKIKSEKVKWCGKNDIKKLKMTSRDRKTLKLIKW